MTTLLFPPELPLPSRDGYLFQQGESRLRTATDKGAMRTRRRTSSAPDMLDMAFTLTSDQWARLQRFYYEETKHGAMAFAMPDYSRDGWPLCAEDGAVLTTEDDSPILIAATHLVRFADGLPNATPIGVEWRVSMRVEVLP